MEKEATTEEASSGKCYELSDIRSLVPAKPAGRRLISRSFRVNSSLPPSAMSCSFCKVSFLPMLLDTSQIRFRRLMENGHSLLCWWSQLARLQNCAWALCWLPSKAACGLCLAWRILGGPREGSKAGISLSVPSMAL